MEAKKFLATLPGSVKIGPHTWKLRVSKETGEVPEGKMPNYGLTQFMSQTITIHPDLADSATVVGVLLHELYHASLFSLGMAQPKKEEPAACMAEAMWTTVFRDNLWLLDFMKKGLK